MTDRDLVFLVGIITVSGTLVVFVWQALRQFRANRRDHDDDHDDEQDPRGG